MKLSALGFFLLFPALAGGRVLRKSKKSKAASKTYKLKLLDPVEARNDVFNNILANIPCASNNEASETILNVFYQNLVTRESLVYLQLAAQCNITDNVVDTAYDIADALIKDNPQGVASMTALREEISLASSNDPGNRRLNLQLAAWDRQNPCPNSNFHAAPLGPPEGFGGVDPYATTSP